MSTTAKGGRRVGLVARLDGIEQKRDRLLQRVDALTEEARTAKPADGAWSVLEIVEHLVLAERAVLSSLFDGAEAEPVHGATFRDRLARWGVMWVLRSRLKVPAPSRRMIPTGDRDLEELAGAWRETHRRLRAALGEGSPPELARPRFRHPIAGPLTLPEAVSMLEAHLDRHAGQIERRIAG